MICRTKIIFLLTRALSYRKAMSEEIVTEGETFYWSIYDSRWQLQTSVSALRRNRTSGRFSNFRGLSASVSFSPLPLPPLSFFGLALIFARPKHRNLHGNPTETLATQAKEDMTKRWTQAWSCKTPWQRRGVVVYKLPKDYFLFSDKK